MSNSEGFAGKTATVYKWFGNLPPGTLMRIQVPSKQVTYALYVSPIAFASLDPEIQYGPTQLTEAGDVIPYVYADRGVSKPAPAITPTAVPTTVTYSSLPPAAQPGQVTWTYRLTGFFGNRWEVWERYIRGCVPGMSWVAFKEQVLVHNPHLVQDRFVFYPHKTYMLPEIRQ